MTENIRLEIESITYNEKLNRTFVITFSAITPDTIKSFSILIGEPEGQAISLKMRNKNISRPLTHDLFINTLNKLNASLEKVVISRMQEKIFCSELYVRNEKKEILRIDSRTSDALALAVCVDVPIYIKSDLFDLISVEEGTHFGDEKEDMNKKDSLLNEYEDDLSDDYYKYLTKKNIVELLAYAVDEENYEEAARLRDELGRREQKKTKE